METRVHTSENCSYICLFCYHSKVAQAKSSANLLVADQHNFRCQRPVNTAWIMYINSTLAFSFGSYISESGAACWH